MKFYRPTFAEVDLGAIRSNLLKIKGIVGKGVRLLGVVKADAYGHGIREVSKAIREVGVDYLGVASLDEARELCKIGIKTPIIVLGAILPNEVEGVIKFGITQAISDLEIAQRLSILSKKKNKISKIHIKIDTGMGRLGVWHKEALGFIKKIAALKNIIIEGIFTHFPTAEEDRLFTKKQIKDFDALIKELRGHNIEIPIRHTANSIALVDFKDSHMNMVRPGLMMYGLYPKMDLFKKLNLKPALSLKTKIVYLKSVPKGRGISYGRIFITGRPSRIATIPVGYGDGYSRHLSNRGEVLVRGVRAPIVGRVCMDMSMVDVTSIPKAKVGDEVVLIGRQGEETIRAEELATLTNTIPYEIVCNIGHRVPRVYR